MSPTRRDAVWAAALMTAAAAVPAAVDAQVLRSDPTTVLLPLAEENERSAETDQLILGLPDDQIALLEGDEVYVLAQRPAADGLYPMEKSGSLVARGGLLAEVQGRPAGHVIADCLP